MTVGVTSKLKDNKGITSNRNDNGTVIVGITHLYVHYTQDLYFWSEQKYNGITENNT